jgi:hypothetical protein
MLWCFGHHNSDFSGCSTLNNDMQHCISAALLQQEQQQEQQQHA